MDIAWSILRLFFVTTLGVSHNVMCVIDASKINVRPVARGGSGGSIEPPFWINPGIQLSTISQNRASMQENYSELSK